MSGRNLLSLSSSTLLFSTTALLRPASPLSLSSRVFLGFRPLYFSTATTTTTTSIDSDEPLQPLRHSILLEKLRLRHLRDSSKPQTPTKLRSPATSPSNLKEKTKTLKASSFRDLGIGDEVMAALEEMGISVPTEIQCLGIPAVLDGKNVVLGSHTGSGKTLAYMLPLIQLMRRDEEVYGRIMKPKRPRAVVLCPTRELSEQVFHVAKSISHHARFRSTMVSGGVRMKPQEDSLSVPIDMVVGTPGRVLQHIKEGNMVYGDIKYLVLDEADTMFDHGFGQDIRSFLGPLKNRASKPGDQGFQTILVSATMTKAVQRLIDEEFQGINHLRTSTLHKKIASARHDFIKLSGSENKLEALLQVLEPSLARGNRVMVFCNTLNSSRAVDHFLNENQISTVNYHGEVPAEQRVENLNKFKSEDGDCPTLVCTDLAARGLDLSVDHVIMFDFPLNSIDYLHRTGRTARMGAKGKVTSLAAKRDLALATRIEDAIRKNESLEALTVDSVRRDVSRASKGGQKKSGNLVKASNRTNKGVSGKSSKSKGMVVQTSSRKTSTTKSGKTSAPTNSRKAVAVSKLKPAASTSRKGSKSGKKQVESRQSNATKSTPSKLNVVGFRGRNSSLSRKESLRPS